MAESATTAPRADRRRDPLAGFVCPLCGRKARVRKWLHASLTCSSCANLLTCRRVGAFILDAMTIAVVMAFMRTVASGGPGGFEAEIEEVLGGGLIWVVLPWKDSFRGMSLWRWILGLQVVDSTTGQPAGIWRCFLRNAPLMFPLVRILWLVLVVFSMHRGPRWGDMWTNTRVILRRHAHSPVFTHSSNDCPHCGYNLTGNVSGLCPECGLKIPADIRGELRRRRSAAIPRSASTGPGQVDPH